MGESTAIPIGLRRQLLEGAAARQPSDLTLLMALGGTYEDDRPEERGDRLRWYQAALAVAPKNPAALINIGLVVREKGDLERAIFYMDEAISLDPKADWYHAHRAWAKKRQGDLDAAVAGYVTAAEIKPSDRWHHYNLRLVVREWKDPVRAEACYRKVLGFAPQTAFAHFNLGEALLQQNKWAEAVVELREAIRLDPKLGWAHSNLGFVLSHLGDKAGALASYREGARLEPDNPRLPQIVADLERELSERDARIAPPPRPVKR
jgi:tetratricopeptide (TPR) repeat protein